MAVTNPFTAGDGVLDQQLSCTELLREGADSSAVALVDGDVVPLASNAHDQSLDCGPLLPRGGKALPGLDLVLAFSESSERPRTVVVELLS